MDLSIKDTLEIFVDGDQIVLKKYPPCLHFLQRRRMWFLTRANSFASAAWMSFAASFNPFP